MKGMKRYRVTSAGLAESPAGDLIYFRYFEQLQHSNRALGRDFRKVSEELEAARAELARRDAEAQRDRA